MGKQFAVAALVLACVLASPAVSAADAAPSHSTAANACDLLSDEEIVSLQGERVGKRRGWAATAAGPGASTCYFELPTAAKSITLMVGTAAGETPRKARQAWQRQFEPHESHDRDANGREHEEEEEGVKRRPPQKVRGLGDAAYWRASPVGGTLHVLKGKRYFALTIGGRKLDEVKALARKVLQRL